MTQTSTPTKPLSASDFTLRLMAACAVVYVLAGSLAYALISWGRNFPTVPSTGSVPPALLAGTVLLAAGSWWMQRAVQYVRLEKQRPFRLCLLTALLTGTTFVGVQSFGLWCLCNARDVAPVDAVGGLGDEAIRGTAVAAFVFVGLHAMHFVLALFALVYVTILATTDRYDHEYHWGVTACACFWHFLGVVWLVILFVFAVVAR